MRIQAVPKHALLWSQLLLVLAVTGTYAKRDPYEVLGVSPRASTEDIKARWRTLARKLHPDKRQAHKASASQKEQIEKEFTEAQEAYGLLSDPEKRQEYDQWGYVDEDHSPRYRQRQRQHASPFDFFFNQQHHEEEEATPIWSETISLTDYNFEHYVEAGGVWLFEFYSPGCAPCHEFSETWSRLAKNLDGIVKLGRIDTDGGYRGDGRTIQLVQQFRRMINGLPSVVAFDGKNYRGHYRRMDYDSLLRFVTEQIPNHIETVRQSRGQKWLHASSDKPRVFLISGQHSISVLFRHAAFELHQWLDFGFTHWSGGGSDVERHYGIKKVPALLIQKEAGTKPLVINDLPKERKKLLRLLKSHRFHWVQKLTIENFEEVCMDDGNGSSKGTWCVILMTSGTPDSKNKGLQALQAIAQSQEHSDLLPTPTAYAWLDAGQQPDFVASLFGKEGEAKSPDKACKLWKAPACFVALNPRTNEWAPWTEDDIKPETIATWLKALSADMEENSYKLRQRAEKIGDLVAVSSWDWGGGVSSPASILMILVAAVFVLAPNAKADEKTKKKSTGQR